MGWHKGKGSKKPTEWRLGLHPAPACGHGSAYGAPWWKNPPNYVWEHVEMARCSAEVRFAEVEEERFVVANPLVCTRNSPGAERVSSTAGG